MTATPSAASGVLVAGAVTEHYEAHLDAMRAVNATAADAFAEREWRAAQATVTRRLDVYAEAVAGAVAALGEPGPDRDTWVAAKGRFAAAVADRVDREIAETFFNSCTRRMLGTVGVDPGVEFTGVEFSDTAGGPGRARPGPLPRAGSGGADRPDRLRRRDRRSLAEPHQGRRARRCGDPAGAAPPRHRRRGGRGGDGGPALLPGPGRLPGRAAPCRRCHAPDGGGGPPHQPRAGHRCRAHRARRGRGAVLLHESGLLRRHRPTRRRW